MPNRIIKESICTSDSIDSLNWFEEVLFYRLIVNCDDYGRFDGRVAVVKNRLFPLKENVTAKAVRDGIDKLASVGLVVRYMNSGKPYLHLPTWNDHQSVRAKRSRYPGPGEQENAYESDRLQTNADVPVIQSESYSEYESESEYKCDTPAPTRHKYGTYKNVLLTDQDLDKLMREFPCDWGERIERLSEYMASSGKRYKDHLATIRNWARRDRPQQKKGSSFLDLVEDEE